MREILFRGKRTDNGELVYGLLCVKYFQELPHGRFVIQYKPKSDHKEWQPEYMVAEIDAETVGQYTGLTDKNGKKIFDGDICRNPKNGEIVSVKWHGTMAGFVLSKRKEKSNLFNFGELFRAYDKYEVIGNIHDNPELLKGE